MKKTETLNEIKNMDGKALVKELNSIVEEISKTKAALTFGKEKNMKKIFELKKKRARVWTILTQKTMTGEENDK